MLRTKHWEVLHVALSHVIHGFTSNENSIFRPSYVGFVDSLRDHVPILGAPVSPQSSNLQPSISISFNSIAGHVTEKIKKKKILCLFQSSNKKHQWYLQRIL